MKITLLENLYDSKGNEKVKTFFQKVSHWIQGAGSKSRAEWKRILMRDYSQYLVGSGNNTSQNDPLLESCQNCSGECSSCYIRNDKGEGDMSVIDKQIKEAFAKPYVRPKVENDIEPSVVYQLQNGQMVETEKSKLDRKVYQQEHKEQTIVEVANLSEDEKILVAFK